MVEFKAQVHFPGCQPLIITPWAMALNRTTMRDLTGYIKTRKGDGDMGGLYILYNKRIPIAGKKLPVKCESLGLNVYITPKNLLEEEHNVANRKKASACLLYTSPSPRDRQKSRMPSSA